MVTPFIGRRLGDFEWIAFEEVLSRWSNAIKEVVTAPRHRPPNRTSQWAHRRRRREQEARSLSPATEPPADPTQPAEGRDRPSNHRASGYARQAARAKVLQKLYQANPGACMRRLLDNTHWCSATLGNKSWWPTTPPRSLSLLHWAHLPPGCFQTDIPATLRCLGQLTRVMSSRPLSPQRRWSPSSKGPRELRLELMA